VIVFQYSLAPALHAGVLISNVYDFAVLDVNSLHHAVQGHGFGSCHTHQGVHGSLAVAGANGGVHAVFDGYRDRVGGELLCSSVGHAIFSRIFKLVRALAETRAF
jgi:hypothetical protein